MAVDGCCSENDSRLPLRIGSHCLKPGREACANTLYDVFALMNDLIAFIHPRVCAKDAKELSNSIRKGIRRLPLSRASRIAHHWRQKSFGRVTSARLMLGSKGAAVCSPLKCGRPCILAAHSCFCHGLNRKEIAVESLARLPWHIPHADDAQQL